MDIHLASLNPSKIQAVLEVLGEYSYFDSSRILTMSVASGVDEQPKDIGEIMLGARTRAYNAFVACDYTIALESGTVDSVNPNKGKENISVCSIYDGKEFYFGESEGFEIPEDISEYMDEHHVDLNRAAYECKYTESLDNKYEGGLISILTKGKITRTEHMKPAVREALSQIPEIQDK